MRPGVTAHFAQSLDGRIATRTGASRYLSGPETLLFAHSLRAQADAVIVGSGTAIADDPRLTVRHVAGPSPVRVLLDARGRVPPSCNLLSDACAPTLHVTCAALPPVRASHVEHLCLPADPSGSGVDLDALVVALRARGLAKILLEGGQGLLTSFFRKNLVDTLFVTVAPIVIGAGIDAVGDLGVSSLSEARSFELMSVQHLGKDALLELQRGVAHA